MNETRDKNSETLGIVELGKVDAIINNYGSDKSSLIAILQDAQAEYGYLPQEVMRRVATNLGIPLIQVFGVATFFRAFRLTPKGRFLVRVCLGTACHVRGAPSVLEETERRLKVKAGGTTDDGLFTLETVNCLGCCALGPVAVVGDEYVGQMKATKVAPLIKKYAKKSKG
ncbi:MAG TPA: NAD(P)H-dependent oxidoreductase subunit E [Thermoplasmata archaeon]|jgi:NADH-quinone oxidoreductase subunit E